MQQNDEVITVTKARENLADILGEVRFAHKRIKLTSNGKGVGAIVPLEDLELLEAIEDKIDIELADEAMKEKGSISLDEVLKELGLTREELTKQGSKPKRKSAKVA
jgi:prevent-host-death family protein